MTKLIKYLIGAVVLVSLALFMYGCGDVKTDEGNDVDVAQDPPVVDATDDTADDGDTVTVTIPPADPSSDGPPVVVEIPRSETLQKLFVGDAKALAIPSQSSATGAMYSGVSSDCGLGELSESQYTALEYEGATPCFTKVEFWGDGVIYGKYYLENPPVEMTMSVGGELLSVAGNVELSILTDASGDVYHLPGHPVKGSGFKNNKVVKQHAGKPTYINHERKLVRYNFATQSEEVVVDGDTTGFSFREFSNGTHIIHEGGGAVKRIKPDMSEETLNIPSGQWHDIGDSIQYVASGHFKRMVFGASGDIMLCGAEPHKCYSNPQEWQAWLDGQSGGVPPVQGHAFNGSLSGCDYDMIGGERIMICSGKAFRVGGVTEDMVEIDWKDYGHPNINTFATVKMCASQNYIYFYAESDSLGTRLTRINNSTGAFQDVLSDIVLDIGCVSDSELTVIRSVDENTEAISITSADVNPVVAVIGQPIEEIITP